MALLDEPSVPVGVRNHNPLNIRAGQPYNGLAVPGARDGFANFTNDVWGFRAAFRNYIAKHDRGVLTIRQLITEWAPPSDNNDTGHYIQSVSAQTGIDADVEVDFRQWPVASAICRAQAVVEQGKPFTTYFTEAEMAEGAFRAGILDAPAPLVKRALGIGSAAVAATSGTAATLGPIIQQTAMTQTDHRIALILGSVAVIAAIVAGFAHAKPKTAG